MYFSIINFVSSRKKLFLDFLNPLLRQIAGHIASHDAEGILPAPKIRRHPEQSPSVATAQTSLTKASLAARLVAGTWKPQLADPPTLAKAPPNRTWGALPHEQRVDTCTRPAVWTTRSIPAATFLPSLSIRRFHDTVHRYLGCCCALQSPLIPASIPSGRCRLPGRRQRTTRAFATYT
jgi:hypothetical protein